MFLGFAMRFVVHLAITLREPIRDPEGETIKRELFERRGVAVESVRAGKYLRIVLDAESPEDAASRVDEFVKLLRLANPAVHEARILLIENA